MYVSYYECFVEEDIAYHLSGLMKIVLIILHVHPLELLDTPLLDNG